MKTLTKAPAGSSEWHYHHTGKIGGSTAADILGCGRHTRKHAWATLTGRLKEDISKLPHVQLGVALEPVIARMWEDRLGRRLDPTPGLIGHDSVPWMVGTPDGIDSATGGPWEAKAVGFWRRREWKLGVPLRVRVQGQWYSALLGNPGPIFFGALALPDAGDVGGSEDEDDEVPADSGDERSENDLLLWGQEDPDVAFQERAINEVGKFYDEYVKKDVEPPAMNATDIPIIKALHPQDDRSILQADEKLWQLVEEWEEVGVQMSARRKYRQGLAAAWMDKIKDATWIRSPDGKRWLRYKTEARRGFTVTPSAPRIPRLMREQKF